MIPARAYTAEPPCSVLHSLVNDRMDRETEGMRSDNPLRVSRRYDLANGGRLLMAPKRKEAA